MYLRRGGRRRSAPGQVRLVTGEDLRTRLALSQSGLDQLMQLLSSSLVPALAAELKQGLSAS